MGAIGDLRAFTMYQAANSMREMAQRQGQPADAMGMGMGAGFGMMLPGFLQQTLQHGGTIPGAPAQPAQTQPPAGPTGGSADTGINLNRLRAIAQDPAALVRQVANAAGWTLRESDPQWEVVIPLGPLRKQTVRVRFDRSDAEGQSLISLTTSCGPATEQNAMTLLRFNASMAHGAFAVESTAAGEMLVIQANHLADTADVLELTRTMAALAWQADQVEAKLVGEDRH
jgi:hypothetical protein